MKKLTKKYLKEIADENLGGMSDASKMPWLSWSLNSDDCKLGAILKFAPGSVCSGCYADKGNYNYPNVVAAQARRLDTLSTNADTRSKWVDNFVQFFQGHLDLGLPEDKRYFRWFDSGDLQSVEMLADIVEIARRVPEMQFWLPTREMSMIKEYLFTSPHIPDNICIRISANRVGKKRPSPISILHPRLSDSAVEYYDEEYQKCPASEQDNSCGDCRKCWDPTAKVGYPYH
tara:strand:+ start:324 stop:1016 length:693 start_codon:yes stop_codon:yes gene_type:complete